MTPYIIDPMALEDDVANLTQPRFLRKAAAAKSPGGTVTNTVVPGQALPQTMRQRLGKIGQELDTLDNGEVDTTALQNYAKQQGQSGEAAMLNALAAQYAGEQFQPVQAQFLKRAMAAQEPMKLGAGMLTPDGQYLKDPFAARDSRRSSLERQYSGLLSEVERQERADQARQDRLAQQQRDFDLRRDMFDWRRDRAANTEGGAFQQSGYTPDGKQLVTNRTGMNFILEQGPQGQPVYTPYTGAAVPKTTWDKNVQAVQEALGSANRADAIIKQVDANPDAFGLRAAAVSKLPGFAQGRVSNMIMDPETMKLRSDVLRSAAMEISQLYGAALSLGEQARASTFIPDAADPPEVVIQKLRAARDWAKGTAQSFGGGVLGAAQARSGGGQQAPAPNAGGGLSADEKAELEALRKKHRGG